MSSTEPLSGTPPRPDGTDHSLRSHLPVIGLLSAISLVLVWAYWVTVQTMVHRWSTDPQYSHGFLVPIFAAIVLWARKPSFPDARLALNWRGLPFILGGALLRLIAALMYFEWLDTFSLLPTLVGICVLLGGWPVLRWCWPGVAFLIFMMPAPYQMETALAHPLQRLATVCSTYLLQTFGLPAISEGNVILLKDMKLGVVEACSGLGMLVTFFALSTAVALIVQRSWTERVIVFLSAIPIALITNIVRITATGILYVVASADVARAVFHDLAGWLMMPLALLLLYCELKFLSRLFIDADSSSPIPLELSPLSSDSAPDSSGRSTPSPESHRARAPTTSSIEEAVGPQH